MVQELAKFHGDEAQIDHSHLSRDVFSDPPWVRVRVAEFAGEVVGYSALAPLVKLQYGQRGMDLHHLFVEQAFRGRGVGRALLESSKQAARDLQCSYLLVGASEQNLQAHAYYLAAGFEKADSRSARFRIRL